MKKFYLYFPILNNNLVKLDWNYYRKLLNLDRKECYFYYRIIIFCNSNLNDALEMIDSDIFYRI